MPFRTVEYNGLRAQAAGRLSSAGKLPVLDYDGERVQDSTAIFEYLEKRHPTPALLPLQPEQRALALTLEDWADESLYFFELYLRFSIPEILPRAVALLCAGRPAWERAIFGVAAKRLNERKLQGQGLGRVPRARVEEMFTGHLDHIDALLGPTGWLVGSACTIADVAVGAQLAEVRRTSHLASRNEQRPRIAQWLERLPKG